MNRKSLARVMSRIVACVVILALGVVMMLFLAGKREAPAQAEIREKALQVTLQEAVFEDVLVRIEGMGRVRARDIVEIAPEIPGRIVKIHPDLEAGEIIPAGEILFEIDPRDYQARRDEAQASVAQLESSVLRLTKQLSIDQQRLITLRSSEGLAQEEYERIQRLFTNDKVGSQSSVDQSKRAANTARDQADQLEQTVSLYPLRIQEAKSTLASAEAMAQLAVVNLERSQVRTAFDARIKEVNLELGQYVSPGIKVVTLADDSLLEISVGIPSNLARNRLQFVDDKPNGKKSRQAWFRELLPVPVDVSWTERDDESHWKGMLHRIEKFDPDTRTLTVVVRIEGEDALSLDEGQLPLVEGMFCTVSIPGKKAHNVVCLPAESVSFPKAGTLNRNVYLAKTSGDNGEYRLQTVVVKESHFHGDFVFISEGLEPGDMVVTTRLVNPLENTLLNAQIDPQTDAAEETPQ